jgi:hypothetical protein
MATPKIDKERLAQLEWLLKNLVYCEDTHSFTHRMYDAFKAKKVRTYHQAQHIAQRILFDLYDEHYRQTKPKKGKGQN